MFSRLTHYRLDYGDFQLPKSIVQNILSYCSVSCRDGSTVLFESLLLKPGLINSFQKNLEIIDFQGN